MTGRRNTDNAHPRVSAATNIVLAALIAIVPSPSFATYAVWLKGEKAIRSGCEPTLRSFTTASFRMSMSERFRTCC